MTWFIAGSSRYRDFLLSSRSQVRVLPGAPAKKRGSKIALAARTFVDAAASDLLYPAFALLLASGEDLSLCQDI
jgi:hypothetical protein